MKLLVNGLLVASVLCLVACSQDNQSEAQDVEAQNRGIGALTESDLTDTTLDGELGCSFTTDEQHVLLVAMGNVASEQPSDGVIKFNGALERVGAPGGFDRMLRGTSFQGGSPSISIHTTGKSTDGTESPPQPAQLIVNNEEIQGYWNCGP